MIFVGIKLDHLILGPTQVRRRLIAQVALAPNRTIVVSHGHRQAKRLVTGQPQAPGQINVLFVGKKQLVKILLTPQ